MLWSWSLRVGEAHWGWGPLGCAALPRCGGRLMISKISVQLSPRQKVGGGGGIEGRGASCFSVPVPSSSPWGLSASLACLPLGPGTQLVRCLLLPLGSPPTLCSLCGSPSPPSACLPDRSPPSPPPSPPISPLFSFEQVFLFWQITKLRPVRLTTPTPVQAMHRETSPPVRAPPLSRPRFQTPANHKLQALPDLFSVPKIFFQLGLLLHAVFCKQPSLLNCVQQTSLHANKYRSTTSFLIAA